MKKISLTYLFIILSCLFVTAQTPDKTSVDALQEAASLNAKTVQLFKEKNYEESEQAALQVISIRAKHLKDNDLLLGQSYWNLANIQFQLGKKKEADKSFDNAFEIYEKNQPLSNSDEKNFAILLERIAYRNAAEGFWEKAENKLVRVVELNEKLYGADSKEAADKMMGLAEIYRINQSDEKAKPLLLKAFEIKKKKFGLNDETDLAFENVKCVLTRLKQEVELKEMEDNNYPKQDDQTKKRFLKGDVVNGKAVRLIAPPYPQEARAKRAQGIVQVNVMIDESGKVIYACAVKGAKELQRASELAAYGSTFTSTILKGEKVKVTGTIIYNFVAQ